MFRISRAFAVAAALAPLAAAAAQPSDTPNRPVASKTDVPPSVVGKAAPAAGVPTHHWHDGERRRPLWIDPGYVADFTESRAGKDRIVESAQVRKDTAGVSPLFRDAPGGSPRALPGGVIVQLRDPVDEAGARRLLESLGLTPLRAIGAHSWLVASAPGLPALELANALHGVPALAGAQPNWWQPRALK